MYNKQMKKKKKIDEYLNFCPKSQDEWGHTHTHTYTQTYGMHIAPSSASQLHGTSHHIQNY